MICRGLAALKASFAASIGDVVFGMEDGAVSIFGLVFGMATAAQSSAAVLLAGATGAAAAAVSMMAGVWLDARSERDREQTLAERYAELVRRDPEGCTAEIDAKLRAAGMAVEGAGAVIAAAAARPDWLAASRWRSAQVGTGLLERSPAAHGSGMRFAVLPAPVPVLRSRS